MARLTPRQIAYLAEFVYNTLRRFPLKGDPETRETIDGKELWEYHLSRQVDNSPELPNYIELQMHYDDILDYLVNYYGG